ncbi:MAG: YdcF family protein [Burkholderiaceae bacterium]|nr:YdcF family protein [Burkholderiaceae bacterium]
MAPHLRPARPLQDIRALLVMGGEDRKRWPRSRAALAHYQACVAGGGPVPCLIVTGGAEARHAGRWASEAAWMAEFLESEGVPPEHLWRETLARNTLGNVVLGGALALWRGITVTELALVSDDFHLGRCRQLFTRVFGHAPTACLGSGDPGSAWLRLREPWAYAVQARALHRAGVAPGDWQAHFDFLNLRAARPPLP